ncbi:lysoplasmalogenase [Rhodococcus sp. D2-41]|uniref:Lysoplasmalogenase n=1 Tax=Speluncibacter jeojiensis TaxID=2710754 RepID=A0A9X4M2I9_9ACTN|nr:lysoplasmalogenase [Rhodococcus sp. D2-41]MDG3010116.1 lysoplasmalogenase [Rhodococcus sp. D2-41]MDG3015662.1 lysoplasmalogenase [Corynebacteriales bacterium D3-21]
MARTRRRWRPELGVFAAAAAATVAGAVTGRERVQQVAKPLIAPALAVGVVRALRGKRIDGPDGALLLIGLGAATVGDVFLIDPDDDARLTRGATAFGVMQSSYTTLLRQHHARPHLNTAAPRALAWAGATGLLAAKAPNVVKPLAAYGFSLATTATLAGDPALAPGATVVAGMPLPGRDPRSRLALGGLVFTVSDGLIVARRLLLRSERGRAVAEGVILATYAVAQVLLVEGMLRLSADR